MKTARAQPVASARALPWSAGPLDVLRAWPAGAPLACLISGGTHGPRARWSIFAAPTQCVVVLGGDADPLSRQPFYAPPIAAPGDVPFQGGWIGALSYELGRVIEPRVRERTATRGRAAACSSDATAPLVVMQRCPGAYVHDRRTGAWYVVGDDAGLPEIDVDAAHSRRDGAIALVEPPISLMGRPRFEAAVAQTVEYIRAGDIFQANIAHPLRATVRGERRAVAARMFDAAGPWYGAYVELPGGGAVASVSPELFLEYDPRTRRVLTRPIKGTRPAEGREARNALKDSEKDRAELTMIVDLMRNDLGRVCAYGSVAVDDPRAIEHHGLGEEVSPQRTPSAQREELGGRRGTGVRGAELTLDTESTNESVSVPPSVLSVPSVVKSSGVFHGVATVSGVLRDGLSVADLLRAAFPPGSVTGAPKIRAMQIIDELEQRPRGFYCGAVGYLSDCGRSVWNVAIRTATLTPSDDATVEVVFPVGAGIVADSNPAHEWEETMHKASVLMAALGRNEPRPSRSGAA